MIVRALCIGFIVGMFIGISYMAEMCWRIFHNESFFLPKKVKNSEN